MNSNTLSLDSSRDRACECPEDGTTPADEAAETAYYIETLKANRRIAPEGAPLGPGQTHVVERDEKGRPVLRRKRFSAI